MLQRVPTVQQGAIALTFQHKHSALVALGLQQDQQPALIVLLARLIQGWDSQLVPCVHLATIALWQIICTHALQVLTVQAMAIQHMLHALLVIIATCNQFPKLPALLDTYARTHPSRTNAIGAFFVQMARFQHRSRAQ